MNGVGGPDFYDEPDSFGTDEDEIEYDDEEEIQSQSQAI